MKRNRIIILLTVFVLLATGGFAQNKPKIYPCGTDIFHEKFEKMHPEVAATEADLEKQISAYISRVGVNKFARTASIDSDTIYYDIPVVVHVTHNHGYPNPASYSTGPTVGPEDIKDDNIYALISEMNRIYSLNYDTSVLVPEFKKYIGKAYFRFHLASIDPNGNPTKGITRTFTYLTHGADNEAKVDDWAPQSYMNIWFEGPVGEQVPGGILVAYTIFPTDAVYEPFYDGIIGNFTFINDTLDQSPYNLNNHIAGSFDHEVGHFFGLYHTFGTTNNVGTNSPGNCGSSDYVDDTPPTDGCLGCLDTSTHPFPLNINDSLPLWDTVCCSNYFVVYPSSLPGIDSLVNYPDTANEQNIMNYAGSRVNFTKGQVQRMRGTATSTVANRSNLWSISNLIYTGILSPDSTTFLPTPDLPPITDYVIKTGYSSIIPAYVLLGTNTYFTVPGASVNFYDQSWQDTIMSVEWQFPAGNASVTDVSQDSALLNSNSYLTRGLPVTFSQPGWVSFTMSATGNNTGTTTTVYPRALFVANATGTPADGYFMEFNNADTAQWPTFNYYNNGFKWQYANVGYYDNSCIEYTGFDTRVNPSLGQFPYTGSPAGDFDDMFSIPMDLTGFGSGECNLNFYYSGASRSSISYDINDSLEIDYSTDGVNWTELTALKQGTLDNKGSFATAYTPSSQADWAEASIPIPISIRKSYIIFRFRYWPNVTTTTTDYWGNPYSSGNNFYMDRINFSPFPASVNNVILNDMDVVLAPNPTAGDAYVLIKDTHSTSAEIVVSDITGKVTYTTTQPLTGGEARVQIPHTAISVKGIYMVQTTTGSQVHTQKLIVD